MKYDFGGWATRNDLLCADGRTIRKDAFKSQDGMTVPLVWNHNHSAPENILGLAHLENRDNGVYAYCEFNDNESGKTARELVRHGDVRSLSIFANKLQQVGGDVVHGMIREVSLVLAGANPGAFIDDVMAHGEDSDEGIIAGYDEVITLYHSDDKEDEKVNKKNTKPEEIKTEDEETIEDVFNTLSEKQKTVVYAMIGSALEESGVTDDEDEEGDEDMKHNVFENDVQQENNYLCHADQESILNMAKNSSVGTFQNALNIYAEENPLSHTALSPSVGGFYQTYTTDTGSVDMLFPEYKEVRPGAPELITNDQGWVIKVIDKVHKSPISRIRTTQAAIKGIDALKAKGFVKGNAKEITGNIPLIRRTTDPQTIYVKNVLYKDDITDITDFDYVQYLYNVDRMMLNEELATAIMVGDGRDDADPDKIFEEHIRPIWKDDDLYTIHTDIDLDAAKKELQGTNTDAYFGENFIYAEAMINAVLYARENYKGSGTPDMFITPHDLNVMLLARDMNGRRIYGSVAELASAMNVANIYTAEQFTGLERTDKNSVTHELLALIVNLADYSLGSTKGGEISHFTQFDIDFNREKSLIETRVSGALTRVWSAIAIEKKIERFNS